MPPDEQSHQLSNLHRPFILPQNARQIVGETGPPISLAIPEVPNEVIDVRGDNYMVTPDGDDDDEQDAEAEDEEEGEFDEDELSTEDEDNVEVNLHMSSSDDD
ncbi:hypothetical protein PIB30_084793 [Stylosanthes scabra]|uniref:Uncharacterized protein n=1 Tax=Stylosanthes scabra TaxID=79078 RepID=A0ABU6WVF5_9FABA|nr:hypothetical protein [Stylosanthes scabra]